MSIALSPCHVFADREFVDSTATPTAAPQFHLHTAGDERSAVEAFVQRAYHDAYGAHLREFMPWLLELRQNDTTQAALGMRAAGGDIPLFLEQYLDQPIEQIIAGRTACPVARADIVEIGNLAATRRGASPLLFLIMAASLHAAGYRWLAFTATPQVRKLVVRLRYPPLLLSEVDPSRLGERVSAWGRYYDTHPQVMCVALADALGASRASAVIDTVLEQHHPMIARLAQQLRVQRSQPAPAAS